MDDEPQFQSFMGCVLQFLVMGLVSWLVLLGTGLLIFERWCKP